MAEECQYLANIGFDHRFEPVTFTLGPAHTVAWGLMGATVTYQGKSTRVPVQRGSPARASSRSGIRASGPPDPAGVRDYIELFVWRPAGEKWSLDWSLYEVIREELVSVAGKTAFIAAATPSDAREAVSLGVDQDGNAAFTVHGDAPSSPKCSCRKRRNRKIASGTLPDLPPTREWTGTVRAIPAVRRR